MIDIPIQSIPFIIGHSRAFAFKGLGGLAVRSPGFLPEGVAEFLFATNYLWWVVLGAVGLAAIYVGKSRAQRKVLQMGLALVGMGVVWVVLAMVIDTPRERLEAAHRAILHAVEVKNPAGVLAVMAPDFHSGPLDIFRPEDRKPMIEVIVLKYPIKSNRITALTTSVDGRNAKSDIVVFTELENFPLTKTHWRLEWTDEPAGDWRLTSAELVSVDDQAMPDLHIPKGIVP